MLRGFVSHQGNRFFCCGGKGWIQKVYEVRVCEVVKIETGKVQDIKREEEMNKMEAVSSKVVAEPGVKSLVHTSQSGLPCIQPADVSIKSESGVGVDLKGPESDSKPLMNHSGNPSDGDVCSERVDPNKEMVDPNSHGKSVPASSVMTKTPEITKPVNEENFSTLETDLTTGRSVVQSKRMSRIADRLKLRVLSANSKTESGSDGEASGGLSKTIDIDKTVETWKNLSAHEADGSSTGVSSCFALSLDLPVNNIAGSKAVTKDGDVGPSSKKQHMCSVCHKIFPTSSSLKTHKQTHSGKSRNTYSIKRKAFTPRNRLKPNGSTASEESSRSSCADDESSLLELLKPKTRKRRPQTQTDERPCMCSVCGKSFRLPSILKQHRLTHSGDKPHHCSYCGKGFVQAAHMRIHIRTHTGERPFTCHICGKSFGLGCTLKRHSLIHTGERPFKCGLCNKSYICMSDLNKHRKTHSESLSKKVNNYPCKVCGKRFPRPSELRRHNFIHTGEKPYVCTICGKGFPEQYKLRTHSLIHTGEKPHVCNVCGKGFTQHSGLISHSVTHTGERPYTCDTCGKTFTHPSALSSHKRIHTGEKPYTCTTCGKSFGKNCSLKTHMLTHTGEKPFVCDVCGKSYNQSYKLKTHKVIHTGRMPYNCDLCGKGFTEQSGLKRHGQSHTGEKPFTCEICGQSYTRQFSLKIHYKKCKTAGLKSVPNSSSPKDEVNS